MNEPTPTHPLRRRLLISLLAAALCALALSGRVDQAGADYTAQGFKRALVTFAVARGLNAAISVAQGTQLAVEPAGIGLTLTPGQVLDPINDLVERFSWVMLASSTALGIQRLLLEIFAAPAFSGLLAALVGAAVVALWWSRARTARPWLLRAALFMLMLRFAVPCIALAGEGVYSAFLQQRYHSATQRIEQVTQDIRNLNSEAVHTAQAPTQESLLERAKRVYRSAVDSLDVQAYVQRYEKAAADISEQVVNLIVTFVVQTILLPLLFLWLVARGLSRIWRLPLPLG